MVGSAGGNRMVVDACNLYSPRLQIKWLLKAKEYVMHVTMRAVLM